MIDAVATVTELINGAPGYWHGQADVQTMGVNKVAATGASRSTWGFLWSGDVQKMGVNDAGATVGACRTQQPAGR